MTERSEEPLAGPRSRMSASVGKNLIFFMLRASFRRIAGKVGVDLISLAEGCSVIDLAQRRLELLQAPYRHASLRPERLGCLAGSGCACCG